MRCEHKYPIFKKCIMFIPKSTCLCLELSSQFALYTRGRFAAAAAATAAAAAAAGAGYRIYIGFTVINF